MKKRVFINLILVVVCVVLAAVLMLLMRAVDKKGTTGFSPVGFISSSEKGEIAEECPDDVEVVHVSYTGRNGTSYRMNIAVKRDGSPKPLMMCVHGDTYMVGSRTDLDPLLFTYANKGYVVASVDYGVLPDEIITSQQEAVEDAADFLATYAGEYEIDPKRFVILGVSSGAQLVARLAENYGSNMNNYSYNLSGVILVNGLLDFGTLLDIGTNERLLGIAESIAWVDGEEEGDATAEFAKIDPLYNINSDMPPVLILHGSEDPEVPAQVARNFYDRLRAARVTASLVMLQGMQHDVDFAMLVPHIDRFLESYA